jgi:uncharacterized SAM-binding protein YcdF (DUF218 family)
MSFVIVEVLIISSSKTNNIENVNYIILLGAGLNKNVPSLTLTRRIDIALHYLNNNPNAKIIASGGKGRNEELSEAEIIAKILENSGINNTRIIKEEKSRNTSENFKYSTELIGNFNEKIIIVSSEFHLFRAKLIARKEGFKNIGTLACSTPLVLLPNYYIREYFAIIKELMVGNI